MTHYIKEDPSYFEGVDLENAKPIKHPLIEKLQANAIKNGGCIKLG